VRLAIAALLAITALGPVASATPPSAAERARLARAQFDLGRAHFASGEFVRAMEEFEEGYRLLPLPRFLFNVAQAARRNGDWKKALTFYQLYLEKEPDAPERPECEQRIAEMRDADARHLPPPATTATKPPVLLLPMVEATPSPPPSATPAAVVAAPAAPPRRWWRDPAGAVLCAGGIGGLAVGAGLLGSALTTLAAANQSYDAFDRAHAVLGLRTAGAVVLGGGALLLVGGLIRYAVVARHARR
jgi:tetratricopeptide (TPR) repeat protein